MSNNDLGIVSNDLVNGQHNSTHQIVDISGVSSNEAISTNQDTNIVDDDVIRLFKYTKRKINCLIGEHQHQISKLKKSLNKFDQIMYKNCKHDWERDPPQMYTLSSYTCKKCWLSK